MCIINISLRNGHWSYYHTTAAGDAEPNETGHKLNFPSFIER